MISQLFFSLLIRDKIMERAEDYSQGLVFQEGKPFDLTEFKQEVRVQDFPINTYIVDGGNRAFDITIPSSNSYLYDVEFWVKMQCRVGGNNTNDRFKTVDDNIFLTEMSELIKSVEIYVDSQRLLYIDDARYLLSILAQQKDKAHAQGVFKIDAEEQIVQRQADLALLEEIKAGGSDEATWRRNALAA